MNDPMKPDLEHDPYNEPPRKMGPSLSRYSPDVFDIEGRMIPIAEGPPQEGELPPTMAPMPTEQDLLNAMRGMFRMADAELALGVEPIDLLEAVLDKTKDEWAAGAAMFGPFGMYDDDRKALLSARQIAAQSTWNTEKQGSLTDKKLDAAAHADETYTTWLATQKLARAKWLLLDQARSLIHARIARGNALLRATSRGG